jgi:hypothetical protein
VTGPPRENRTGGRRPELATSLQHRGGGGFLPQKSPCLLQRGGSKVGMTAATTPWPTVRDRSWLFVCSSVRPNACPQGAQVWQISAPAVTVK